MECSVQVCDPNYSAKIIQAYVRRFLARKDMYGLLVAVTRLRNEKAFGATIGRRMY